MIFTPFDKHPLPSFSEEALDDALFHYTSSTGLLGILQSGEIWSTSYFCTNDLSELSAGRDLLSPIARQVTEELIRQEDQRVQIFAARGIDIRRYAMDFQNFIVSFTLEVLNVYITCFCKATAKEDFFHGLLSQWRGYGEDGGYAIQFSRSKLKDWLYHISSEHSLVYQLADVHYSPENPLRDKVLKFSKRFEDSFSYHLDYLADILEKPSNDFTPLSELPGGPIETLMDYLIYTKSRHFREENECRLSLIVGADSVAESLKFGYFSRQGLVVPYVRSPQEGASFLDCIEWILIGPSPRIDTRLKSIKKLIENLDLQIKVRPSHIPYSRI